MPKRVEVSTGTKLFAMDGQVLRKLAQSPKEIEEAVKAWEKTEKDNQQRWRSQPTRKTDFRGWQEDNHAILHGKGLYRRLGVYATFLGQGVWNKDTLTIEDDNWGILLIPQMWEFPYDRTGLYPHFEGRVCFSSIGYH